MMMKARHAFPVYALLAALACASTASAQDTFNAFKDPVAGGGGTTSGPDLKAVTENITAGAVPIGSTTPVNVLFMNPGTSPVNVLAVNLYPSSNVTATVMNNKCSEAPLPSGAQCPISLSVQGLLTGSWRVEVLVDHDGRTRLATAAATGSVEAGTRTEDEAIKADIESVPESISFAASGSVPSVRALLLRNRTSDVVKIKSMRLDAPETSGFSFKSECGQSLKPSETCVVNVSWLPVSRGVSSGSLVIEHDAKSSITKVDISGTFTPSSASSATVYPEAVPDMGLLVADKEQVDFGSDINSVSAITISLVNQGAKDVMFKSIRLAGSDNGLSIARTGCKPGLTLRPTQACPLTLNWVPSREGSVVDDLQILHTGARGVLVLPIRGTAIAAASRESIAVRQPPPAAVQDPAVKGAATSLPVPAGTEGGKLPLTEAEAELNALLSEENVALTPSLDGYNVTSHSPTKAVINGPIGSIVVRDGEDVVVSGVRWTVTIVSTGVVLANDMDEILLVFDRSLRPFKSTGTTQATSSSSSSSSDSGSSSSSSTGSDSE